MIRSLFIKGESIMGKLDGKVALVTGAGTGLGRGIATALGENGATVVLVGRREEKLNEVKQEIGDKAIVMPADAANEEAVAQLVQGLKTKTDGKLDILVNNAGGVVATDRVDSIPAANLQKMLDINLMTQLVMTKACLPMLRDSEHGKLISVTSGMVNFFMEGMGAYSASKAAAEALMRTVAEEEKENGVQVNMFDPLNAKSEGNPQGQYEPAEIVDVIVDLAAATTMDRHGEIVKPNV